MQEVKVNHFLYFIFINFKTDFKIYINTFSQMNQIFTVIKNTRIALTYCYVLRKCITKLNLLFLLQSTIHPLLRKSFSKIADSGLLAVV